MLFSSCGDAGDHKQKAKPVQKAKQKEVAETDDMHTSRTVQVAWPETFNSLPVLKIETIPEDAFPKTTSKSYLTQTNAESAGNYFYLKTDKKQYRYLTLKERNGDSGWCGNVLNAYYPDLGLYTISAYSSSEGLGFCNLFLLDKHNDWHYHLVSIGDDCVSLPLPSPDQQFLVYYYNWQYENNHSEIVVIRNDEKAKPEKRFIAYAYFNSKSFQIDRIVWHDAQQIIIRGFEEHLENERRTRRYAYYKAIIP